MAVGPSKGLAVDGDEAWNLKVRIHHDVLVRDSSVFLQAHLFSSAWRVVAASPLPGKDTNWPDRKLETLIQRSSPIHSAFFLIVFHEFLSLRLALHPPTAAADCSSNNSNNAGMHPNTHQNRQMQRTCSQRILPVH